MIIQRSLNSSKMSRSFWLQSIISDRGELELTEIENHKQVSDNDWDQSTSISVSFTGREFNRTSMFAGSRREHLTNLR